MSNKNYPPNEGQSGPDNSEPAEDQKAAIEMDEQMIAEEGAREDESAAEVDMLKDRLLRLAAELENTRRRSEREKTDAARYSIAGFARDLLKVSDTFERALQAADSGNGEAAPAKLEGLLAGLKLTEKELLSVFERHGVQRISPAGEKFDPNLHQAVAHLPHAEIPSGHVIDVAQAGFTIGDRVLRAAMVTVSNGPGGAAPEAGSQVDTEA